MSDVYRFFNTETNAHFYTTSTEERDSIIVNYPSFIYEGNRFDVPSDSTGMDSVFRFYNTLTNTHFYTIDPEERDFIMATWPQFVYEGVAYSASEEAKSGFMPLYRFYNTETGTHFYTTDENERQTVMDTYPQFQDEGIAYYVLDAQFEEIGPPIEEPDIPDNLTTTASVSIGESIYGAIEENGDADWYQVDLWPNTLYEISLQGEPSGVGTIADPFLSIYDSEGVLIDSNDDGGIETESVIYFTHPDIEVLQDNAIAITKTYYISAETYPNLEYNDVGFYVLSINENIVEDEDVPSNVSTSEELWPENVTIGLIDYSHDNDWYRLVMSSGQEL